MTDKETIKAIKAIPLKPESYVHDQCVWNGYWILSGGDFGMFYYDCTNKFTFRIRL